MPTGYEVDAMRAVVRTAAAVERIAARLEAGPPASDRALIAAFRRGMAYGAGDRPLDISDDELLARLREGP
jgi:hypothetical protein